MAHNLYCSLDIGVFGKLALMKALTWAAWNVLYPSGPDLEEEALGRWGKGGTWPWR